MDSKYDQKILEWINWYIQLGHSEWYIDTFTACLKHIFGPLDPLLVDLLHVEAATKGVLCKNRPSACNFIKKETLAQVFSCEFCQIS